MGDNKPSENLDTLEQFARSLKEVFEDFSVEDTLERAFEDVLTVRPSGPLTRLPHPTPHRLE